MEKIIWTPELSVGVAVFDEHHKQMILMINRLIDAQKATTNCEAISDLLNGMTRYIKDHLKAEEKMMAEYGYPQFAQHKAEHMAFMRKTANFCIATQTGVDSVPHDLLTFLRDWLTQHIQNTDKAYTPFFNSIGIQ